MNKNMTMHRILTIATSLLLLVLSTAALTVVDTKRAGFSPIQLNIDEAPSCEKDYRVGPSSWGRSYGPVTKNSNAKSCCADYPFCGCPKLESPEIAAKKKPFIKLPPAKQEFNAKSDSPCCPDYPFCGCPKLETPKPRFNVIEIGATNARKISPLMIRRKARALVGATEGTCSCCPNYPYCSCSKL